VSPNDGLPDDMRRPFAARRDVLTLDEGTATRLLAGQLHPSDAPPGYGEVASLVAAAAAPPRLHELASEEAARRLFRAAASRPRTGRRWRVAPLVAALTVTAVVLVGGAAAATATGSLPGPAQGVAHDALGAVGVSVPSVRGTARRTSLVRRPPTTAAPRPLVPRLHPRQRALPPPSTPASRARRAPVRVPPSRSAAMAMLCRAYDAGRLGTGGARASRAYEALAGLAGGPGNIPGYCGRALG
jgi:hypothetical protein